VRAATATRTALRKDAREVMAGSVSCVAPPVAAMAANDAAPFVSAATWVVRPHAAAVVAAAAAVASPSSPPSPSPPAAAARANPRAVPRRSPPPPTDTTTAAGGDSRVRGQSATISSTSVDAPSHSHASSNWDT